IKKMADQELNRLSGVFNRMYSQVGRPSIAPERILKSLLLIALYSVRSERQLCEQMGYNLLFRWFLDMELEEESFDATVFSKNRDSGDGARSGATVFRRRGQTGARSQADERRSFHGRRDPD